MKFKPYWQKLDAAQREKFATDVGTAIGYCNQIAFSKKKRIELGLADAMVAVSGGVLTLDDLPLTARAQRQRTVRSAKPVPEAA